MASMAVALDRDLFWHITALWLEATNTKKFNWLEALKFFEFVALLIPLNGCLRL